LVAIVAEALPNIVPPNTVAVTEGDTSLKISPEASVTSLDEVVRLELLLRRSLLNKASVGRAPAPFRKRIEDARRLMLAIKLPNEDPVVQKLSTVVILLDEILENNISLDYQKKIIDSFNLLKL